MFSKLKEKLKSWTHKFSKEKEEEIEEGKEEVKEKLVKEKRKAEKADKKSQKKSAKASKKEKLSKEESKEVEIPIPEKFNVGTEKFEPDLDKIKEIVNEIAEETREKPKKEKIEKPILEKEEEREEKQGFFSRLKSKISKVKITEEDFEGYSEDLKMLLLENNVAYEVAENIISNLRTQLVGREILKKELESEVNSILRDIIEKILLDPFHIESKIADKNPKPYVILFCGINGTGKTTTIAKVAHLLKKRGISCIMAASDTFRAASIEQIKQHSENLKVKLISHDYGSDPASVGFDAIKYAQKNRIDCVLIDTAGRMHTEKNLLKELEKVSRVCKPDLKIFVGEATTGNDSIEQAKSFNEAIGIDAIILAKADTDEKGGTALSLGYITKKPILYLGVGQGYDSLELFNKKKFTEKLGL